MSERSETKRQNKERTEAAVNLIKQEAEKAGIVLKHTINEPGLVCVQSELKPVTVDCYHEFTVDDDEYSAASLSLWFYPSGSAPTENDDPPNNRVSIHHSRVNDEWSLDSTFDPNDLTAPGHDLASRLDLGALESSGSDKITAECALEVMRIMFDYYKKLRQ